MQKKVSSLFHGPYDPGPPLMRFKLPLHGSTGLQFFAAAYLCSPTYPRLWNKPAYRYARQRPRVAWWWVFRDSVIIAFEISEPVISRVRARSMPLSTRLRYACSAKMNRLYQIEDTKMLSGRTYKEKYLQISYAWMLLFIYSRYFYNKFINIVISSIHNFLL